jgi:hypothetical protein
MAFTHGKGATMSVDATDISAYTDSVSLGLINDLFETTTFGAATDDKTFIAGLNDASVSIGGKWDATVDAVMWGARDGASVAFSYSPDGGTTTYSGNCFLSNYNQDSPVGSGNTWTATFQSTGLVTRV